MPIETSPIVPSNTGSRAVYVNFDRIVFTVKLGEFPAAEFYAGENLVMTLTADNTLQDGETFTITGMEGRFETRLIVTGSHPFIDG